MDWQVDAAQRPGAHLTLIAAFVMTVVATGSGMAAAQQTIYVGGSGKAPVEINLGVIESLLAPTRRPLVLDPPGEALHSAFLLGAPPASAAAPQARPLAARPLTAPVASLAPVAAPEPKPAAAIPKPVLSLPKPTVAAAPAAVMPEPVATPTPAPVAPVSAEPLPEPMPESMPEPVPPPPTAATATVALAPPEPVAEPVATPAPAPEPAPEPKVAALSAKTAAPAGQPLSIPFAGGSADLPDGAESDLQAVAKQLAANDALRAQVKAYAEGSTGSASSARRLSLSRALAVRSVLIELGVRSTRIDVRALGDRDEGGAPDRVDVLVINR